MDDTLVGKASHGDHEAFAALVRTHVDWMFAVAQRILRDFDRAEDAVQQALVIAWKELRTLRDHERFEAWLRRILVRECYLDARRARRIESVVRLLPTDAMEKDDMIGFAMRDELEHAFKRLPVDQRAILVLHHYLGLTPSEIADSLGVPAGTARSRLHYAHSAMRAALDADSRRTAKREGLA